MDTVIEARIRQALLGHGEVISADEARHRLRGFALGNLHLDGAVTRIQLNAGVWYAELAARYYGLTGIPFPSPRAQNLFAVRGHDGETSRERARKAREASELWMRVEAVLLRQSAGRAVSSAVKTVCVSDVDEARGWPKHMIGYLTRGLQSIAENFDCPDWRA